MQLGRPDASVYPPYALYYTVQMICDQMMEMMMEMLNESLLLRATAAYIRSDPPIGLTIIAAVWIWIGLAGLRYVYNNWDDDGYYLITVAYCRYRNHIDWNSSKIISRPNSLRPMRSLTPTWAI